MPENVTIFPDGAWCWLAEPRAVHYLNSKDKTYWGSISHSGDVMISSYDHNSKEKQSNVLHYKLSSNDHSSPTILIRNDGHVLCFYTKHNEEKKIYWRISIGAEDISSFEFERSLETKGYATYPKPIQLSNENNHIYLFYRSRNPISGQENEVFHVSNDGGLNFAVQTPLLSLNNRTYTKIISNGKDRIDFCATKAHDLKGIIWHHDIYHFYYRKDKYYLADGTLIKAGLPLIEPILIKLYDSDLTGHDAWIWDIAYDSYGNPNIAFVEFLNYSNDHKYKRLSWSGNAWSEEEIACSAGHMTSLERYSGGISFDQSNPDRVYCSIAFAGLHQIACCTRIDFNKWSKTLLTQDNDGLNWRPCCIRNANPELKVIWMHGNYNHWTDYQTKLMTT